MNQKFSIWLSDIDLLEHPPVSKTTELLAKLTQAKFPIVPGYIITPYAYTQFLKENFLDEKIKRLLHTTSITRQDVLMQTVSHIHKVFLESTFPDSSKHAILAYYHTLGGGPVTITLIEKEPNGRKHIILISENEGDVIQNVILAWAEMFSASTLWHRHHLGYDLLHTNAEVLVQKQIQFTKSGTVTTVDPETHAKDVLIITTNSPHGHDTYHISKKNLTIIDRKIKQPHNKSNLTTEEILAVSGMGKRLESYLYFPQEIFWGIIGNKLYCTEIKPFTGLLKTQKVKKRFLSIMRGKGLTNTIGTGPVIIVKSQGDLQRVKPYNVVVLNKFSIDQVKHLKHVRSLIIESPITDKASQAYIKQLGIPVVELAKNASKNLHSGNIVTVHARLGEIYNGGYV